MSESNEVFVQNIRFYGDMRFKQLTLLMAVISLAWAAITNADDPEPLVFDLQARVLVAIGAALFTLVLWAMEVSSTVYAIENRKKASDLWPRRASRCRMLRQVTATNAVLVLHILLYGFWSLAALEWSGRAGFWIALPVFPLLAMCIHTCERYGPLWEAGRRGR
jgi:hypothetical protein